jgi:hypothetical protein
LWFLILWGAKRDLRQEAEGVQARDVASAALRRHLHAVEGLINGVTEVEYLANRAIYVVWRDVPELDAGCHRHRLGRRADRMVAAAMRPPTKTASVFFLRCACSRSRSP